MSFFRCRRCNRRYYRTEDARNHRTADLFAKCPVCNALTYHGPEEPHEDQIIRRKRETGHKVKGKLSKERRDQFGKLVAKYDLNKISFTQFVEETEQIFSLQR